MKERKVIAAANMPPRLPLYQTATIWLLLDRYQLPQWLWGALGVVMLVVWVASIWAMFVVTPTRIWPEQK